jgi:glycosyltransferase involved in cell wall biosynthesis
MDARVSVVVPVYNPGEFIGPCINSLLGQTMPPGDLEVLFIDDGSTDETPALLDKLADEHSHIRVVHQENSGWPGKPRNVGLEAATGDYVMFMDQDDALGSEAMQRMHDFGARNEADIVIGKVTSNFRSVPHQVWRTNVEKCTIRDHDLIRSLTPHKMFRRRFLLDNNILYPEGKRRLEDQLFMVKTYLAAERVSVLGDYPCYFYLQRADGGNAGSGNTDPHGYYQNLREVLDVIDATVEPGAFRDSLQRRFYRSQLGKLKGSPEFRLAMFTELRDLARARFPDSVAAGLETQRRIQASLVREGRPDDLAAFAARVKAVKTKASLDNMHWDNGVLHADFAAAFVLADGSPLRLELRDGRRVLDSRIVGDLATDDLAAVQDVDAVTVEVVVRHQTSAVRWFVPTEVETVAAEQVGTGADTGIAVRGHLAIDPLVIAGGAALDAGGWVVSVRLHGCGISRPAKPTLANPAAARRAAKPASIGSPTITVTPRCDAKNPHLILNVSKGKKALGSGIRARLRRA